MKTMPKSNIGYRGLGADGKPVEWYYGWNPGGFGCSGGCDGCWSKAMTARFQNRPTETAVCEQCRRFEVHLHPERLGLPAATKKPGVVLVNFTCDTFDPSRAELEVRQIGKAALAAPWHNYVWLTRNAVRLRQLRTCPFGPDGNH
jgi:protein gp37